MRFSILVFSLMFFSCGAVDSADVDMIDPIDSALGDTGQLGDSAALDTTLDDLGGGSEDATSTDAGASDTGSDPEDAGAPVDVEAPNDTSVTDDSGSTECTPGETESCVSVCNTVGEAACDENGVWGTCWPPDEICNGIDDNCDNETDNAEGGCTCIENATQACGATGGVCVQGTQSCVDGTWGPCGGDGMVEPSDEICDALDNDCNGITDDTVGMGCECEAGEVESCGTNVGECTTGTADCVNGLWGPCSGVGPVAEVCNGLDDDCDNVPENGIFGGCMDAAGTFSIVSGNAVGLQIKMSTSYIECVGNTLQGCIIPVQPNSIFDAECTVPANREILGFGDSQLGISVPCPGPSCTCESLVVPFGSKRCTYSRAMPNSSVIASCTVALNELEVPKD